MELNQVIVGVDFSDASIDAVRWTAEFVAPGAHLVLANAVNVPEPPSFLRGFYPPTEQLTEAARRGAEVRLRELTESLGKHDIEIQVHVGRPEEVLTTLAKEREADLIVVGAHGERAGIWKLLGSTAEHVAQRAPTSVLLARACPPRAPATVVVALDETEMTRHQLAWARYFTREPESKTVAIHVAKPVPQMRPDSKAAADPAEEQLRRPAENWLQAQMAAAGIKNGIADVSFGDACLAIPAAVDRFKADLLIIGGHGARPASGPFMGSVAEFLLRNGRGPVLVASTS